MAIPVKAVLAGAATIGVGATGIWAISTLGMPEWRPLVQDSEASYSGKYAEKYTRLLVGVGSAEDTAKVKDNKDWGDWAFKNLYEKDKAKGGFKDLTQGPKPSTAVDTTVNSLQAACKNAYQAETGSIVEGDSDASDTSKFKEEQVGLFCSPVGKKPKTLAEGTDKTKVEGTGEWIDKVGAKNKDHLLSISDNDTIGQQLDLQAKSDIAKLTSGFFFSESNGADIKTKCTKAYGVENFQGSDGTDNTKPKEDEVYKGCSLKGVKTTS